MSIAFRAGWGARFGCLRSGHACCHCLRHPPAKAPFAKTTIELRELGPRDVLIKIAYAGICHSDIHTGRDDGGEAPYPLVPGHEIAGVVEEIGSGVDKFEVGARVGVGSSSTA